MYSKHREAFKRHTEREIEKKVITKRRESAPAQLPSLKREGLRGVGTAAQQPLARLAAPMAEDDKNDKNKGTRLLAYEILPSARKAGLPETDGSMAKKVTTLC